MVKNPSQPEKLDLYQYFGNIKLKICRESFVNLSVEKVFFMNDVHKNQFFLYLRLFGHLCGICFFSNASSQIKGLIKHLKNPFQPMWHSIGFSSREWESKSRQDNTKNEIAFHFGYKDKSEIFCSVVLHSCVFVYMQKGGKKSKKKIILCLEKSCTKTSKQSITYLFILWLLYQQMQILELTFNNSSKNCSHQVRMRNASIPNGQLSDIRSLVWCSRSIRKIFFSITTINLVVHSVPSWHLLDSYGVKEMSAQDPHSRCLYYAAPFCHVIVH